MSLSASMFARSLVVTVGLATSACASPPTGIIYTDGRFDDWSDIPFIVTDERDTPDDAAVDLIGLAVADDPTFLHLRLDVGRAVNAQSLRGAVAIALDADGNVETGARIGALEGTDIVIELSRQDVPLPGGFGRGIGYRLVDDSRPSDTRSGYDVDLIAAPTFASDAFEVRLARAFPLASGDSAFVGSLSSVQVMYVAGEDTLDATPVGRHRLVTQHRPLERGEVELPGKQPGVFRALQWNVGETQLRDQLPAFARIIRAVDPDVVLLDEVFRDVQVRDIQALFDQAVHDAASWDAVIGRSGGRQKTVVASRLPLRAEPAVAGVQYPDGSLDSLMRVVGDTTFGPLVRIEAESGIPAVGAWVTVEDREVLFVSVDLQSAGHAGSPRDRLRVLQARTIHGRVDRTLGPRTPLRGSFPIVIGGDFNLVGSRAPLDVMSEPLANAGPLATAEPYRLGDRTQATWRDSRDVFTPGRLDFTLYTPSTMRVRQSFVFDTEALTDSAITVIGVRRDDVLITSNHLPTVTDFEFITRR